MGMAPLGGMAPGGPFHLGGPAGTVSHLRRCRFICWLVGSLAPYIGFEAMEMLIRWLRRWFWLKSLPARCWLCSLPVCTVVWYKLQVLRGTSHNAALRKSSAVTTSTAKGPLLQPTLSPALHEPSPCSTCLSRLRRQQSSCCTCSVAAGRSAPLQHNKTQGCCDSSCLPHWCPCL